MNKPQRQDDGSPDAAQWPPAPTAGYENVEKGSDPLGNTKLLTGKSWSDILLASLVSFVSVTLITNLFFNSWAASVLPSQETFPSGVRLCLGWFLACTVHIVVWRRLLKWRYFSLNAGFIWSSSITSFIWLLIISVVCFIAYA